MPSTATKSILSPEATSSFPFYRKNGNAAQMGKAALCFVMDHSGLNAIAHARNRDSVLVLSYHGVISDKYAGHPLRMPNMVTLSEFRAQMNELRRRFNPVTVLEVRRWVGGLSSLPPHAVLVTFDDGYANSFTHAVPVLRDCEVPAVFFVATGYIGEQRFLWPTEVYLRIYTWPDSRLPLPHDGEAVVANDHASRARIAGAIEEFCKQMPAEDCATYLSALRRGCNGSEITEMFGDAGQEMFSFLEWDHVRAMSRMGFEIGSHSVEHPILARISHDRLAEELHMSKQRIEQEIGEECFSFAYPNGGRRDFTSSTAESVRSAGYELAFTLIGRVCDRSLPPTLLDRVWIPGGDGLAGFHTRTSGMFSKLKQLAGA